MVHIYRTTFLFPQVVQCLLSLGERIDEPHTRNCKCAECSLHADELRVAKTRLNTYKALASDAYIVLASTDPIFQAFELGQKLRKLAIQEKHYKVYDSVIMLTS